ncbi:Glutamate-rich WD repeat-containing protein 1 [Bienertia sinuspersici]
MVRGIKNSKKTKRKKNKGSSNGEASASSASASLKPVRVWQPGVDAMGEDEELQCDPSAYNSLHAFHVGWPCLSFDIVRDSLGLVRTEFPHTVYVVAGTQADKPSLNSISIFKVSNISGKRRELVPKNAGDGSDMDSDTPQGGSSRMYQSNSFHATESPYMCNLGRYGAHLNFSAESETGTSHQAPMSMFRHKDEGYALDWSPLVPGRLVSGDCQNFIHLWEPASGPKWNVDKNPYVGHAASVEDLQWSPTEAEVFASASVDKTIAIWDTRLGKSSAASFKAHDADVNVISWNRLASCMLASGSDDGSFTIHDLRMVKEGNAAVAHFTYHKHPITSIEWNPHEAPHEASTLAVSSADNQLTIWDLSLERDNEEEEEFRAQTEEKVNAPEDLPPQLLFVHQGQKDLKEIHWHSQIPGMIISTAADGFNILMPSNIQSNLPENGA